MIPIYYSIIASAFVTFELVHYIVVAVMLGPILIAVAQSNISAFLYACYIPWFLLMAVFFLVYVPTYSFVRLWDTTWGNRFTERDDNIDQKRESDMKKYTLMFACSIVVFNIIMTVILGTYLTRTASLYFMSILFLPGMIQMVGCVLFLFVMVPARACLIDRDVDQKTFIAENKKSNKILEKEEAARRKIVLSKHVIFIYILNYLYDAFDFLI